MKTATPGSPGASTDRGFARQMLSGLFTSHIGVLLVIPGLVLAVGATFMVLGQVGLRTSIDAGLRSKMADLVSEATRASEGWLINADPMVQRLSTHVQANPVDHAQGLAVLGEGLLVGRRVMTRIGITAPDGSETILAKGDDGLHFTQLGRAPLPPWYAPAVAAGGLTWVAVERGEQNEMIATQAVRDHAGTVIGVIHVHADPLAVEARARELVNRMGLVPPPDATGVDALSPRATAEVAELAPEIKVLICTADGRLLAGAAHDDLRRPVLAAVGPYLRALPGTVLAPTDINGSTALIGAGRLVLPGSPPWYAVVHLGADSLLAPARAHLQRSLVVALVVIGLSLLLALGLANHLTRQRRIASKARAQAASANERLRSLGSYKLIRKLGEGGMGTVWLAEHEMLARPAAVKLVQVDTLAASKEERDQICARFAREARVTAGLRCPNTIMLYDYGLAADGAFYYAMELLDGLDLERLVQVHGAQKPGRVIAIMEQACRSLIEAHASGMIHRDIKPANLFLCRLGTEVDVIKVLDFGLVTGSDGKDGFLSGTRVVQGTPAFMAPEQACAQKIDSRADLYALGCVMWWLLHGRMVFDLSDGGALMRAHVSQPTPPVTAAMPPELAGLLLALLAKDPDQRPHSARVVLDRLLTIRCPPEQAWGLTDAESWWAAHRPPSGAQTVVSITATPSLLMPARSGLHDPLSGVRQVLRSTPVSDPVLDPSKG